VILATLLWVHAGTFAPAAWAQNQADEEAIKRVVIAETDKFFARDFDGWAATLIGSGTTQAWNNNDGSYTHRLGWATISRASGSS
jgi:hypothetical protein